VKEGTFFARFTDPKNPKEFKDFAIICANGMLRGMNNLAFSTPVSLPTKTPDVPTSNSGISLPSVNPAESVEYTIPK
jgi:hypothetical protein